MKRLGAALCGASLAATAGAAEAQTRGGWEIGVSVQDYGYEEAFGADRVNDDGLMVGVQGAYTFVHGAWNVRTALDVSTGEIDYRFEDERIEDVRQSVGTLEVLLGRDVPTSDGSTLTPFIGIGSRVLADDSGGRESNFGSVGYDRTISYQYVPLGLRWTSLSQGARSITLSAQYNWVVAAQSESHFSDIDPTLPNVELDSDGGGGFAASAALNVDRGDARFSVGPYVRWWDIARSESLLGVEDGEAFELYKPDNSTWEVGLRASYAF